MVVKEISAAYKKKYSDHPAFQAPLHWMGTLNIELVPKLLLGNVFN
jgi:hypothetical protein